jgi:uncharacterized membrane protein
MNRGLIFRLVLGLSLALNVAVLVGFARHEAPASRPWQNMPDDILHRLTKNLSPADSAAVHRAFDARREDFDKMREKIRGDLDAVDASMKADPFDLAALRRAMDDVHRDRTAGGLLIEDCTLESAKTLSSDGRAKLFPPQRDPNAGGDSH